MARKREPKVAVASTAIPAETLQQKVLRLEQENAALKKQNADLQQDKDILKKAAAFFARENE
jgi:transposase-like protein